MTLADLNGLPPEHAESEFLRCCGSLRWARMMTEARPFADVETLARTADRIWASLAESDWLQAFGAHPRIGGRATSAWSSQEQSGADSVDDETRRRLARGNRQYEVRFGHTFLICATGKSAEEMLGSLEQRLQNDPAAEQRVAAEEQRKITNLRLRKLLAP